LSLLWKTHVASPGSTYHFSSHEIFTKAINDRVDMGSMNFDKVNQTIQGVFNRPFILLNLSFFLVFLNISFLYLYPLALDAMGAGHHVIGLVMGVFSVASVI
jgi:hypothetical protein